METCSNYHTIESLFDRVMIELFEVKQNPRKSVHRVLNNFSSTGNVVWVKPNTTFIIKPIGIKAHEYLNNNRNYWIGHTQLTYKPVYYSDGEEIYIFN